MTIRDSHRGIVDEGSGSLPPYFFITVGVDPPPKFRFFPFYSKLWFSYALRILSYIDVGTGEGAPRP